MRKEAPTVSRNGSDAATDNRNRIEKGGLRCRLYLNSWVVRLR